MQIIIHSKHFPLTDAIKNYAEENLPSVIQKYFATADNADVTFTKDGTMFAVEIRVNLGKKTDVITNSRAHDAYAAFDEALEHAAKKIRRHKRKLVDYHEQHASKEAMKASYFVIGKDDIADDEEAIGEADLMVNEQGAPTIIAEEISDIKTMDVASAVMRLDLSGRNALLFKNSKNERLSLVYVRPDGNIGWVEPQLS